MMAACSQQRVRVYEDSSSADRSSCEFSCLGVESSAGVCNRGIACGGLNFHAGFAWWGCILRQLEYISHSCWKNNNYSLFACFWTLRPPSTTSQLSTQCCAMLNITLLHFGSKFLQQCQVPKPSRAASSPACSQQLRTACSQLCRHRNSCRSIPVSGV